ncbi:tyrosine-type recombinase/integrase [Tolypothrix sp. LEGE 11397]|uniref:tyrosine-type recombinase/integrase n=1 Tax=Tolypothrix sp. LEGE 11397 TaxID=2777971 RepID=UPI001881C05F|nr:tyrosine-type recombinase/integrase [Tolypothrix sp. LEGE 11397]MBE9082852.1 tyrosine-type recombinase/integrase [Tolypothrix sp. LEGE 11397]
MKINRFGKAEILNPQEITLLFSEGFVKPRDRALFGVCLYAAARINESCTLLKGDVIGAIRVRSKLIIRAYNTKGGQDTREIQVHPRLKEFLEEYSIELKGRNPHLFPGRHGLGHIHKASADRILREALRRVDLDEQGISTHSFRRTALSTMSDAGIPLRHIQSVSGHRSLSALERYLGVTEAQKENAISSLAF